MNEIYIKILAQRAKLDSTLLDKLPQDVRKKVESEIAELEAKMIKEESLNNERL